MGLGIDADYDGTTLSDMDAIGSRIRALRKTRLLTQVQLAKELKIDQSTLSDIERGAGFSAEILMALADVLHTSSSYIMKGGSEDQMLEDELVANFHAIDISDREALVKHARGLSAQAGAAKPFNYSPTGNLSPAARAVAAKKKA